MEDSSVIHNNNSNDQAGNSVKYLNFPRLQSFKNISLPKIKTPSRKISSKSFQNSMENFRKFTNNTSKMRKKHQMRRNTKTGDISVQNTDETPSRPSYSQPMNNKIDTKASEPNSLNSSDKENLSSDDNDKSSTSIPSSDLMKIPSINMAPPSKDLLSGAFEIIWRNVVYYPPKVIADTNGDPIDGIKMKRTKKGTRRAILNDISGMFRSGEVTGIMGPSGSGKTVLLNCIAGFLPIHIRKENSGDILVNGLNSIRIGFVEQFDHLHEALTVFETLLFASKIRNAARYYLNHEKVADNVMKRLHIKEIADIAVSRCSNGQRKRVSIAVELVFNSDILMLDEPTTGVDSVSGYQIVNNLKSLTKRRKAIAILATIHQPSARIFALFDNLIILSCRGSILYQGHPNNLMQTLNAVGLQCPLYSSVSDFILEIASGDYGEKSLQTLTEYNRKMNINRFTDDFNEVEMNSLREAVKRAHIGDQRSSLLCTWLVMKRCFICTYRSIFTLKTRIPALTLLSLLLVLLYGKRIGEVSTCATKYALWNTKINDLIEMLEENSALVHENLSFLMILCIVALYNSLLEFTLTIPNEIKSFRHEYNNYSYSIWSYYLAKIICVMPFTITTTTAFAIVVHRGTGQIFDHWNRLYLIILSCSLITLYGQTLGILLGTIFYRNFVLAVFSSSLVLVPVLIFSGYFKTISQMSSIMAMISYGSFMRPALNSMIISTYGLDRCVVQTQNEFHQIQLVNQSKPEWIDSIATLVDIYANTFNQTKLMDKSLTEEEKLAAFMGISNNPKDRRAIVLQYWNLSETYDGYYFEILQLIIHNLLLVIFTYLVMFYRLKREKN